MDINRAIRRDRKITRRRGKKQLNKEVDRNDATRRRIQKERKEKEKLEELMEGV